MIELIQSEFRSIQKNGVTQSEFEQARRRVIVRLNNMMTEKGGGAQLKQLYAEFETESIFELSSKITNYLLDKQRRDRVAGDFGFASAKFGDGMANVP